MEEVSLNSEPVVEDADDRELRGDNGSSAAADNDKIPESLLKNAPSLDLEFDTFENAYDFYNTYAMEQGFGIKVAQSFFRRITKERYRAKLTCSNAGFKRKSQSSNPKPDIHTNCLAMIEIRLLDSEKWKIIKVVLQHNHAFSQQYYKSHKKITLAAQNKQPPPPPHVPEVHTIKLYRTAEYNRYSNVCDREVSNSVERSKFLELKDGDGYEEIIKEMNRAVYDSLKIVEFEISWAEIITRYGLGVIKWLDTLYEDRQKWVPVYLKGSFLAGVIPLNKNESTTAFFHGYVHKQTSFKEFLHKYDLALHRNRSKEAMADIESANSDFELKTTCNFETQLSKVYTKEIFKKFQSEAEGMASCFNTKQVNANGQILMYIVEEQVEAEGKKKIVKSFEVLFDTAQVDIRCICSLFNYRGYLCRHALNVLNHNGVEEVPSRYILPRWSKDFKQRQLVDHGVSNIDLHNSPNHLYKCAIPIAEAGAHSRERYEMVLVELEELLRRLDVVEDNLML
ncbi:hypothetical protein ACFE04_018607 [Oxalis oulophora]